MWGKILTIRTVKLPFVRDWLVKKRRIWIQKSLFTKKNSVIEGSLKEVAVKMISPLEGHTKYLQT